MTVLEEEILKELKDFHVELNQDFQNFFDSKDVLGPKDFVNVVLEEWKDLREEIRVRVEQRTQLTEIMVALVSGLITAATAATFWADAAFLVFAIIPFITFFFIFLIKTSYIRHSWLTKYIREEIELKKMPVFKRTDKKEIHWLYWENYFNNSLNLPDSTVRQESTNRAQAYNAFNLGTFLICGFIVTAYVSFKVVHSLYQANYWLSIVLIAVAVLLLPIFWIGGLFLIRHSWIKQSDIDGSEKQPQTQKVLLKKLLKEVRVAITHALKFALCGKKDTKETKNQTLKQAC